MNAMERMRRLHGYAVVTMDDHVGRLQTTYVDDRRWNIRHLVVARGHWLPLSEVLVAPKDVSAVERAHRRLHLSLSTHELAGRPEAWTDRPVSQQRRVGVDDIYWYAVFPAFARRSVGDGMISTRRDDRHLRSSRELLGYYVHARDDEIGHVADFLVDERLWLIRYAVVDTRNWWPGKKVLLPMDWVTWVSWGAAALYVNLSRSVIGNAPEYDPHRPLNGDDEKLLIEYYGRPKEPATAVRWIGRAS